MNKLDVYNTEEQNIIIKSVFFLAGSRLAVDVCLFLELKNRKS